MINAENKKVSIKGTFDDISVELMCIAGGFYQMLREDGDCRREAKNVVLELVKGGIECVMESEEPDEPDELDSAIEALIKAMNKKKGHSFKDGNEEED